MVKELRTDNRSGEIPTRPDSSVQLWETLVEWRTKSGALFEECAYNAVCVLPVACGRYEVYAAVHPGVRDPLLPVDVNLLLQVGFILVIDELHNGLPADEGHRAQEWEANFGISPQPKPLAHWITVMDNVVLWFHAELCSAILYSKNVSHVLQNEHFVLLPR